MENDLSKKFIEHINNKRKNFTCPMCQQSNRKVSDKIFELRQFSGGNLIVGGVPITPVIPVTCHNCGNTILINALIANLLDKKNEDGSKDN